MKVLLVNGSPHKAGCTHTALAEVAGALRECGVESDEYWIGAAPVAGCTGCKACRSLGCCVLDDAVNSFVNQARDFDGFVFGSPVHFAAPTGALLAFLGRVFYSAGGQFAGKAAASVVSCRRAGATAALDVLNKFCQICNMPMVTSQYWNMVHGNTPEEVREDLEGMQTMRALGRNMAWMLRKLPADSLPAAEQPRLRTSFIR